MAESGLRAVLPTREGPGDQARGPLAFVMAAIMRSAPRAANTNRAWFVGDCRTPAFTEYWVAPRVAHQLDHEMNDGRADFHLTDPQETLCCPPPFETGTKPLSGNSALRCASS